MAKQPTPLPAADPAAKLPVFRASLSKAERAQVEAALGDKAEPHEVYTALRICLLSAPSDLECTFTPDKARSLVSQALSAV